VRRRAHPPPHPVLRAVRRPRAFVRGTPRNERHRPNGVAHTNASRPAVPVAVRGGRRRRAREPARARGGVPHAHGRAVRPGELARPPRARRRARSRRLLGDEEIRLDRRRRLLPRRPRRPGEGSEVAPEQPAARPGRHRARVLRVVRAAPLRRSRP
jgi:hypothetical protein